MCLSTSLGKYKDSSVFPQDIMVTVANLTSFNVSLGGDHEDECSIIITAYVIYQSYWP